VDISDHLGELAGLLRNVKFVTTNAGLMIRGAEKDISELVGFIGENSELLQGVGKYEMRVSAKNVPIFFDRYIIPLISKLSGNPGLGPEATEAFKNIQFDTSIHSFRDALKIGGKVGQNILGALKDDAKWFNPANFFKSAEELKLTKVGAFFSKTNGLLTLASIGMSTSDEIGRARKRGLSDGESAVAGSLNAVVINGSDTVVASGATSIGAKVGAAIGLAGGPVGVVAGGAAGAAIGWGAGMIVVSLKETKFGFLGNKSVNDLIRDGIDGAVHSTSKLIDSIDRGINRMRENIQHSVGQWIGAE
jgi:hypothetical protein